MRRLRTLAYTLTLATAIGGASAPNADAPRTAPTPPHSPIAMGHWYPRTCCDLRDCFPIPAGEVVPLGDGWLLPHTGDFIPYSDPRTPHRDPNFLEYHSPDSHYYRCTVNGDRTARTKRSGSTSPAPWCFWPPTPGM